MPHRKKVRRSLSKTLEGRFHELWSGVFVATILFLMAFFWVYLLNWSSLVQQERWQLIRTTEAAPGTKNIYGHILSTGQSLSLGVNSSPVLSTTQPYSNLMFNKGADQTSLPLESLTEEGSAKEWPNTESPSSGLANTIRSLDPTRQGIVVSLHGKGGTAYSGLKKGTAPYIKGMTQATNARSYVQNTLQGRYIPLAVTTIHGETDYLNGTASSYASYLQEWQQDYQTDLNALNGTNNTIPLFTNQMNSGWTGELAVAQVQAHRNNPGKVILVGPKYQMTYTSDRTHLTNQDSKYMGELMGKVMYKVLHQSQTWQPLMPTTVTRSGNVIMASFSIPVGPLALDTTNVAARPNYGFSFVQTGGTPVSISSVQLINSNTQVRITLNGIPTGTNQKLRYAWGCNHGWFCGGAANPLMVGGNLRDSDSSVSSAPGSTGRPLYNWAVAFEEPVL